MAPSSYDSESIGERPIPLPSAPLVSVSDDIVLQRPLTRRGFGPGLVIFLPSPTSIAISQKTRQPLDPEPIQKWAEEGFTVIGVVGCEPQLVPEAITKSVAVIQDTVEVDIKDKVGVIG
jgi:carboxymethylenebutenolidase